MANVFPLHPTIFVRPDPVFGKRSYVEILPRRIDYPTEFFRNPEAARHYAGEKSKATGWAIVDETETLL